MTESHNEFLNRIAETVREADGDRLRAISKMLGQTARYFEEADSDMRWRVFPDATVEVASDESDWIASVRTLSGLLSDSRTTETMPPIPEAVWFKELTGCPWIGLLPTTP